MCHLPNTGFVSQPAPKKRSRRGFQVKGTIHDGPKGSRENNFTFLDAETPVWQGTRTAHTHQYGKDEQRRQTGGIDAQTGEVIFARALK